MTTEWMIDVASMATYRLIMSARSETAKITDFFLFGLTSRTFSNWNLTHSQSIDTDLHSLQSSHNLISLSIVWYYFPWQMGNPMIREKTTFSSFSTVSIHLSKQAHYLWIITVYDGKTTICRHKLYNTSYYALCCSTWIGKNPTR